MPLIEVEVRLSKTKKIKHLDQIIGSDSPTTASRNVMPKSPPRHKKPSYLSNSQWRKHLDLAPYCKDSELIIDQWLLKLSEEYSITPAICVDIFQDFFLPYLHQSVSDFTNETETWDANVILHNLT